MHFVSFQGGLCPETNGKKNTKGPEKGIKEILDRRSDLFPVVGIGDSAGGLEALQSLFKRIPIDIGMSFVVI